MRKSHRERQRELDTESERGEDREREEREARESMREATIFSTTEKDCHSIA